MTDEHFMQLAIKAARRDLPDSALGATGCLIVKNGQVLASGRDETKNLFDPTAHAEMVTIRRVGQRLLTIDFSGCTIYCTLQPCPMCMAACILSNISRVVYGAPRPNEKQVKAIELLLTADRSEIEVVSGVLAAECAACYRGEG
jgi:tRNA(Arg) A34 adenosine deaminase TadA